MHSRKPILLIYLEFFILFVIASADRYDDLLPKRCGTSKSANRIIGGRYARLGQFPWIALLYYEIGDDLVNKGCGGSLITEKFVLTAAHCVKETETDKLYSVVLGEHDVNSVVDCEGSICAPKVQEFLVEKIYQHENYSKFSNDIALVELDRIAEFTDFVSPICLPRKNYVKRTDVYQSAGWGITNMQTKESSDVLKTISLKYFPIGRCKRDYRGQTQINGDTQICAGGERGQDTCGGDSGGPLTNVLDMTGSPRYYLIGVLSFGAGDCGSGYAGVYTSVHTYLDWILDKLEESAITKSIKNRMAIEDHLNNLVRHGNGILANRSYVDINHLLKSAFDDENLMSFL